MLSLLRDSFHFFKRERLYFLLILFIAVAYASVLSPPHAKSRPHPKGPSKEVQAFKKAEDKFDQRMSREDAYQDFSKKNPVLAASFIGLTMLFMLATTATAGVMNIFNNYLPKKTFNGNLNAALSAVMLVLVVIIIADCFVKWYHYLKTGVPADKISTGKRDVSFDIPD